MIGSNVDQYNRDLLNISRELNISNKVYLLGIRDDMAEVMPNFDIVCSSSDEAFPNVIGEAMAAAALCSNGRWRLCSIGRRNGQVVQSGAMSMSVECIDLLIMPKKNRINLGTQARNRVKKYFSIQSIAKNMMIYI